MKFRDYRRVCHILGEVRASRVGGECISPQEKPRYVYDFVRNSARDVAFGLYGIPCGWWFDPPFTDPGCNFFSDAFRTRPSGGLTREVR